jgi:hypothetical protein
MHRTFWDADGRTWTVWDVHPLPEDRRTGRDRRGRQASADAVGDERRGRDRRLIDVRGHLMRRGYERGWLCFLSGVERHRLAPIPDHWERWNDGRLLVLLESARRRAVPIERLRDDPGLPPPAP